jgi:hypothetical protein
LEALYCVQDAEESMALLRGSLATASEQSARLWNCGRRQTSQDFCAIGGHDAARETLAPVYAWFSEGLDMPDLVSARELLNEVGTSVDRVMPLAEDNCARLGLLAYYLDIPLASVERPC